MNRAHIAWAPLVVAAVLATAGCGGGDDKALADARSRLAQKDTEGARVQLKDLLQKNPQQAEARYLLGKLMFDAGEAANAEAELRRALELGFSEDKVLPLLAGSLLQQNKGNLVVLQFGNTELKDDTAAAELKTQLASSLAQGGRMDEADSALAIALRRAPDLPAARVLEAKLKAARGDVPAALALVDAQVKRAPADPAGWTLQGDLLLAQGKEAEAQVAYAQSLKLKPDQPAVHAAVINHLVAKKDLAGAEKQLEVMRKALPRNGQTMFFDALLAEGRGEHQKAREITQQLLRAAPEDPRILVLAGQAELKLDSLAQAEALFGKALQVAPRYALARRLMAQTQMRAGMPDKALATLAPLTEGKTPDPEALTLAGQAQMLTGNSKGAQASFGKAAQARPDDNRLKAVQALSKLDKGGDDASALKELEALAGADKGSRVDLALITSRLRRNDLDGALKDIDKLAAKLPTDPTPDQLRGRVALRKGDQAGARKQFEAALGKKGDYMPALASLAMLDLAEQKAPAAKARFEAVVQKDPKNANALLALAEISARTGQNAESQKYLEQAVKTAPTAPMPRLVQIDQLLAQREPAKALNAAQAAVVALPDNREMIDRLGRAQLAAGEGQQAVATFSKLASLQPKSPMPQLRLADAQQATGNTAGAAAAVKRATEIAPDALPVIQAGIVLALRENKPDQALTLARKVQTLQPTQPMGLQLEGDILAQRQQWEPAAAAYRKAMALAPDATELAVRAHSALLRAGKSADAERLSADWQKRHPDDPGFNVHLADQAMASNANAEAEQRYRQVLAKYPDNVMVLNNLAYLLGSTGKPGGVALAEKAVKLAPNQPALLDTLATCLAAEQQWPKAVEAQSQAVSLAPDAAQFRLALAKLQIKAGNKAAARTELDKLSKLGSNYPKQAEVAALLKQVGG